MRYISKLTEDELSKLCEIKNVFIDRFTRMPYMALAINPPPTPPHPHPPPPPPPPPSPHPFSLVEFDAINIT